MRPPRVLPLAIAMSNIASQNASSKLTPARRPKMTIGLFLIGDCAGYPADTFAGAGGEAEMMNIWRVIAFLIAWPLLDATAQDRRPPDGPVKENGIPIASAGTVMTAYIPIGLEIGESFGMSISANGDYAVFYGMRSGQRAALLYWAADEPCTVIYWSEKRSSAIQIRFDRLSDYYVSGANRYGATLTFSGSEGAVCTVPNYRLGTHTGDDGKAHFTRPSAINDPAAQCFPFLKLENGASPTTLSAYQYIHANVCPALKVRPY